jgi:DNA invertase Pin-like site-specific DNA recombinase
MTLPYRILTLSDHGNSAPQIAAAESISTGYVYKVLREHRPKRPRKQRAATSELLAKVRALARRDVTVARIAMLLGCSKAYVYRILQEAT